MYKRSFGAVAACLAILWPAAMGAQEPSQAGIAIDHKSVGCVVAGKYPKMNACFEPNSRVANGRTYFRAEGGTSWYYVVNKPDAPCWSGVLPKPRKELIDKHVDYYVQVTGKDLQESRTAEFHPLVVAKEADCKDKPVGLYLNKADVSVFPSLPPEFTAGGVSTGVLVGAGVAVAGGAAAGIAAATGGDDNNTTTTFPVTTPTTTPGTTTTTTATTMTPAQPGVFRFNFNVSPVSGTEPLDVLVDMCASSPVGSLRYFYDFDGDGSFDFQGPGPGNCQQTRTFTLLGFSDAGEGTLPQKPKTRVYDVMGCAEPRTENLQPQTRMCQTAKVTIDENVPAPSPSPTENPISGREGGVRRLAWSMQLDVPNASGQVVVNGASAVFSGPGRSNAVAVGQRGENRIEAQLVQAGGKPGTWRFELTATASLEPGSIRVVAGDVALVTGDAIVFQLKGTPGERVVFTFLTGR